MNPRKEAPPARVDETNEGESISIFTSTGEKETVLRAASITFERGQVVCRDRDGQMLRTLSAAGVAFASHSPDLIPPNVWI